MSPCDSQPDANKKVDMSSGRTRQRSILHLVHERIGGVGGIQRFDMRVLRALSEIAAALGYRLEVIALNGVAPGFTPPANARLILANGSRIQLFWLLLTRHLRHDVRLVFIAHMRLARAIWPVQVLFSRSRHLLFVHGIEAWSASSSRFYRLVSRVLLNWTVNDIVAVSQYTARRMRDAFRPKRCRFLILPNAQDVNESVLQAPYAASASAQDAPVILTVARMDRHDMRKGIPVSLRAIAMLRNEFPRLKYRIVGDGELRPTHQALAQELGLSSCVEFLGRVADSALPRIYQSCDIFLLPSAKEGFGIVFLEAWQFGLPVICGNVDASPEVVEHGVDGFTIDPTDTAAVAQAIRTLASNVGMRQEFVQCGRRKLLQKYSNALFVDTLRRIVLNQEPASAPVATRGEIASEDVP